MTITNDAILAAMREFKDPESGRDVVQMEQVSNIKASEDRIELKLSLTTHSAPIWDEVYDEAEQHLKAKFPAAKEIVIERGIEERPPEKQGSVGLPAKTVLAVGSGKGGVGKSTVAVSLALALKKAGCRVGLLDADVYGPSVPQLTGTTSSPEQIQDEKEPGVLHPVDYQGIPIMSIGYLIPRDQAAAWRGPMLDKALKQFLALTKWGELDYLVLDMPPGTGDVQITMAQNVPLTHAVVVCTPQEVALIDAVRAINLFKTVNITVLGMVENMSGFICPDNGKRYDIFGRGGAREKAEEMGIAFLGDIPLNMQLRMNGDGGTIADSVTDPEVEPHLKRIAAQVVRRLANKARTSPPGPSLPVLG